jgi:hypothetical protein
MEGYRPFLISCETPQMLRLSLTHSLRYFALQAAHLDIADGVKME